MADRDVQPHMTQDGPGMSPAAPDTGEAPQPEQTPDETEQADDDAGE